MTGRGIFTVSNPSNYIGKIVKGRFPFFDVKTNRQRYKSRPLLVIGAEYDTVPCDFNVLPVSTISRAEHINKEYDLKLEDEQCDSLSLDRKPSYIRTHKQSTINSRDVSADIISDLKIVAPDLYLEVGKIHKEFNDSLF